MERSGLTELVDAMLECTAPIALIIDDVARGAAASPDWFTMPALVRSRLHDVLAPLARILAPDDLHTAAAVLEASAPRLLETLAAALPEPPPRLVRTRPRRRRPE